jgi:hypothetical protein
VRAVSYEPADQLRAADTYARFLAVTGLDAENPKPTVVGS